MENPKPTTSADGEYGAQVKKQFLELISLYASNVRLAFVI